MSDLYQIECTAVPDGIFKDAEGAQFARLSVVLRGVPYTPMAGEDILPANVIDLLAWPSAIPSMNFLIDAGPDEQSMAPIEGIVPEFDPPGIDPATLDAANQRASEWWAQIWRKDEVRAALRRVMAPASAETTKEEFYSYAGLADMSYARAESDIEIALTAAAARAGKAAPLSQAKGLAALRRDDPTNPVVRLADAHELINSDAFAGIVVGDAIEEALTANGSAAVAAAVVQNTEEILRDIYDDTRALIDRAHRGTEPMAKIGEAERAKSWNPLLDVQATNDVFLKSECTATLFENRFASPQFGNLVGSASAKRDKRSASALALNLSAFDRAMATDEQLGAAPEAAPKAVGVDDAADIARRNLAALQAHPTLRKFVRMIVDIAIPIDQIKVSKGFIRANLSDNTGATIVTAFEFDAASNLFEPCPEWKFARAQSASVARSLPLDRGVVQLNIGRQGGATEDGSRRFRIEVMDAPSAWLSWRSALQAMLEAWRKGVPAEGIRTDEPQLVTRGLMVLDTEAIVPAQIQADKSRSSPLHESESRTLYAEDLVDGYRVDMVAPSSIEIVPPSPRENKPGIRRRVFPTGDRTLRYDVIDQAFGMPEENPYTAYAHRDEGYAGNPSRTWVAHETPSDGGPPLPRTHRMNSEVLFCWTGANLGLPTAWPEKGDVGYKPIPNLPPDDLQVKPTYDFPMLPGPILRDGRGYRVMMRARKINGSSITVEAAERLLDHALGDPITHDDFIFTPVERAPAPVVLVEKGQKLMGGDPHGDQPLANQLLVRPGQKSARRLLVSPNIGFEAAERQGQFDGAGGSGSVDRAINFGSYARLARDTGPDAEGRGYPRFPNEPGVEESRALLFDMLGPATRPGKPIYVDRTVAFLGTLLRPKGATPALSISAASIDDELSYWNRTAANAQRPWQGFTPDAVRPILLEVVAGANKSGIVKGLNQNIGPQGSQISIPVMRVEVGPGDTLELEVWANRLGTTVIQQGPMRRLLAGVAKRMSAPMFAASAWKAATTSALSGAFSDDLDAQEKWWTRVARKARTASLSEATTFILTHPVDKPLVAPSFVRIEAVRRVDVASWRTVADAPRGKNQADGEAIFAFGSIRIDRKTTGLVAAECAWIESHPEICMRRTSKPDEPHEIEPRGLYDYREQVAEGQLFVIDKIPGVPSLPGEDDDEYSDRVDVLDLVKDETDGWRDLSASFRTHRARRLVVRLAARSRFAPASAAPDAPAYIWKSATDESIQRALHGEPEGGVEALWIPATRKPAPPRLASATGTLYHRRFDAITGGAGKLKGQKLTHVYRCWLDDWFDSGPYEKLAIICRNDSAGDLPWLTSQVSRWGGDMSMKAAVPLGADASSKTFLRPEEIAFPSKVEVGPGGEQIDAVVSKVALPAPVDGDGAGSSAPQRAVTAVLLTPRFHDGYGRWYCDIELKNIPAFRAILQLSVARYQEHAIEGCKLSEAQPLAAFVLHQPWTFLMSRKGNAVEITASGPSYTERAPMIRGLVDADTIGGGGGLPASQQAARPLVTVELERINDGTPLPVMGPTGNAVTTSNWRAPPDTASDLPPGWARWVMALNIPEEPIEADYFAVRISLSSAHANSLASEPPTGAVPPREKPRAPDGPLIYLPEPLVVQLRLDPA